jgi:hypothetical protein
MRWNYAKLKNDIKADMLTIREMKSRQRESGQPCWNGLDGWRLAKAKKAATIRCCIAAHLNHKIHMSKMDGEAYRPMTPLEQFEIIKGHLKDYAAPPCTTTVHDPNGVEIGPCELLGKHPVHQAAG